MTPAFAFRCKWRFPEAKLVLKLWETAIARHNENRSSKSHNVKLITLHLNIYTIYALVDACCGKEATLEYRIWITSSSTKQGVHRYVNVTYWIRRESITFIHNYRCSCLWNRLRPSKQNWRAQLFNMYRSELTVRRCETREDENCHNYADFTLINIIP